MPYTIVGKVCRYQVGGTQREFIQTDVPYQKVKELFFVRPFSPKTGKGEQRVPVDTHINTLGRAHLQGTFTPASCSASVPEELRHKLVYFTPDGSEHEYARIEVDLDSRLPLTDGLQRDTCLNRLFSKSSASFGRVDVPFIIFLDGDPQLDFVHLQLGRPVDQAHMKSMKIVKGMYREGTREYIQLAWETAHKMNDTIKHPFYKTIRFDAKTNVYAKKYSSIAQEGASDQSTSLVGLAKIAVLFNCAKPLHCSEHVRDIVDFVLQRSAEKYADNEDASPTGEGKILLVPHSGTQVGPARMWLGVAALALYRNFAKPTLDLDARNEKMFEAIDQHLNGPSSILTNQTFRSLMADFARTFFSDVDEEKYSGIPVRLLETLSYSSYGLAKPKEPKPVKTTRSRKKKEVSTPDEVA